MKPTNEQIIRAAKKVAAAFEVWNISNFKGPREQKRKQWELTEATAALAIKIRKLK